MAERLLFAAFGVATAGLLLIAGVPFLASLLIGGVPAAVLALAQPRGGK